MCHVSNSIWRHFRQTKKNCRNILNEKLIFFNHKYFRINEYPEKKLIDYIIWLHKTIYFRGILRCKIHTEISYRSMKTIERSSFGESNKSIPLTPADHHANAWRVILTGGIVYSKRTFVQTRILIAEIP